MRWIRCEPIWWACRWPLHTGKACYIPLGHKAAGGGLFGGDAVAGQIEVKAALARLKPLLEDPAILKIGRT